jgi:hypothetical protein
MGKRSEAAEAIRRRVDLRDELATLIERACNHDDVIQYDGDDWMRMADAILDSYFLARFQSNEIKVLQERVWELNNEIRVLKGPRKTSD